MIIENSLIGLFSRAQIRAFAIFDVKVGLGYEIIDCIELVRRWSLPESWVREPVRQVSSFFFSSALDI